LFKARLGVPERTVFSSAPPPPFRRLITLKQQSDFGLFAASHQKDITQIVCSTRFITYNFYYCIALCLSEQK